MRTTTADVHNQPAKNHPSSVPLYVYRELAAELQVAQAKLDTLTAKNQQLSQENQFLRQEITKVLQSVSQLQKLVDFTDADVNNSNYSYQPAGNIKNPAKQPKKEVRPQSSRPRQRQAPKSKVRPDFSVPLVEIGSDIPETIFIEEQPASYYPSMEAEKKEFNGWLLAITILLIMLTAFGAGYLVVRPFFKNHSR